MKAIITGGAGFVGSHLCDALIRRGLEVVCIDNFITGSRSNIAHLESDNKFTLLEHDIAKRLPENLTADVVYHLASPASPNSASKKSYQALPFETMEANTKGTWHLAEFCLTHNAKFLFASTSEIYGDPKEHPQRETYNGNVSTTGPRSVYDEAKRFGETITAAFIRSKNLDARIIRIFNTYGPRMAQDDGRVVSDFVYAALAHQSIEVYGDGHQTRSFCYVSDLVEGILAAMEQADTKGEIFNLGNPQEFSIIELAQKIKRLIHSDSEIVYRPLPPDDPKQRKPDISKAKAMLHWEPRIDLEEGLYKYIQYIKETAK